MLAKTSSSSSVSRLFYQFQVSFGTTSPDVADLLQTSECSPTPGDSNPSCTAQNAKDAGSNVAEDSAPAVVQDPNRSTESREARNDDAGSADCSQRTTPDVSLPFSTSSNSPQEFLRRGSIFGPTTQDGTRISTAIVRDLDPSQHGQLDLNTASSSRDAVSPESDELDSGTGTSPADGNSASSSASSTDDGNSDHEIGPASPVVGITVDPHGEVKLRIKNSLIIVIFRVSSRILVEASSYFKHTSGPDSDWADASEFGAHAGPEPFVRDIYLTEVEVRNPIPSMRLLLLWLHRKEQRQWTTNLESRVQQQYELALVVDFLQCSELLTNLSLGRIIPNAR